MNIRRKTGLFVLALGSLGLLLVPAFAFGHAHPKGGTPFRVPLVISYVDCAASNPAGEAHNAPLALPSCANPGAAPGTPGGQSSAQLTVGSPDANGATANSTGFAKLDVCPVAGCVAPDVKATANITDVRCLDNTVAGCSAGPANTNGQNDYTGSTTAVSVIRITDHDNAPTLSATVKTTAFPAPQLGGGQGAPVASPCVSTASAGIGSTCTTNTTVNSYSPGTVKAGKLGNIEVSTVNILDAVGATFMTQGIFIP